jgi:hypothetical protein
MFTAVAVNGGAIYSFIIYGKLREDRKIRNSLAAGTKQKKKM